MRRRATQVREVVAVAQDTLAAFTRHKGTTLAAAIAYYTLLSIFPLLLGLLAVLGVIVSAPVTRAQLVAAVAALFPGAGELIQGTVQDVVDGRGAAGVVATLGLLWSARGAFEAITQALDRVWQTPHERSFLLSTVLSVGMVLAVGLIFVASLLLSAGLQLALKFQIPLLGLSLAALPLLVPLLGLAVPLLITFAIFAALYRIGPNLAVPWSCVWPGALLASLFFELSKQAFAIYLSSFAHLNAVYGSIGTVVAMLTWAYYVAIVLLVGAEFNAVLARRQGLRAWEAAGPGIEELAARFLKDRLGTRLRRQPTQR
jgi:membrane protein